MPCGGIYPLTHHFAGAMVNAYGDECFHCHQRDPPVTHFVDEWDAYLHRDCIMEFLKTEEGQVVLAHGHEVILYGEVGIEGLPAK